MTRVWSTAELVDALMTTLCSHGWVTPVNAPDVFADVSQTIMAVVHGVETPSRKADVLREAQQTNGVPEAIYDPSGYLDLPTCKRCGKVFGAAETHGPCPGCGVAGS